MRDDDRNGWRVYRYEPPRRSPWPDRTRTKVGEVLAVARREGYDAAMALLPLHGHAPSAERWVRMKIEEICGELPE